MLKTAFEKLFQMRENAARIRPGADDGYDAYEKPFLDHLEDLRHTLIRIGATLAISTFLCFAFHQQIFALIQLPAKMPMANIAEGVSLWDKLDLITLSPPEFVVLMLKLSFFAGVIISFPLVIYFLFQFILPGLRQVEKKTIIPGALVGFALFLIGVAFAFFLAAPIALKFFYVFENERISNIDPTKQAMEKKIAEIALIGVDGEELKPVKTGEEPQAAAAGEGSQLTPEMREEIRSYIRNSFATIESSNVALRYDATRDKLVIVEAKGGKSVYRIGEYITFISRLVLVFGISFQLPVVVSILVKLELLTARVMRATRTYAWIIILVAAAILTPPDVLTLGLLGGPMIFLYEICIVIASIIERRREKREMAEEKARRSKLAELYEKPSDELTEEERREMHKAEIEQYEREHAHLYEEESDHPADENIVARDSFHGNDAHDTEHDESWHADDHGHDLYHHEDEEHEPVQDWPDQPEESPEAETRPDSDHAEPEDLQPEEGGETDLDREDKPASSDPYGENCAPSGPIVDMNHASIEELLTLPGIDRELAELIVDHRPYDTFADLEIVPGLTDEMVNRMIDRLMLG